MRLDVSATFPTSPQIHHTNSAVTCLLISWSTGRILQRKRNAVVQLSSSHTFSPCWEFRKRKGLRWQCNVSPWPFLLCFRVEICSLWRRHWGVCSLCFTEGCLEPWRVYSLGKRLNHGRRGGSKEVEKWLYIHWWSSQMRKHTWSVV